jgi:hypothetical protein
MMPFCKDCIHLGHWSNTCDRPIDLGIDPVTGSSDPYVAGLDPQFERRNAKYLLPRTGKEINLCGPDGRFFSQKSADWKPPPSPYPDHPPPPMPHSGPMDVEPVKKSDA